MKNIYSLLFFSILSVSAYSQIKYKVVSVIAKESFLLNSGGRAMFGGKSRNFIEIQLPSNTVEWYYAISTSPDEKHNEGIGLAGQLLKVLDPGIGIAAGAVSSILTHPGSGVCDVFLLNNQNDVNMFLNKQPQFSYVMSGSRQNIKEGVVQVRDFVNGICFIGLRNPSGITATNITIEVSAIVKE